MRALRSTSLHSARSASTLLALSALCLAIAGCGSSGGGTETTGGPATTSTTPQGGAPVGVRAKSCGGGGAFAGEIRVTGASCAAGRSTVAAWKAEESCSSPVEASRTSCKVDGLTCLGAVTDRGIAVTCAKPGRTVAFVGTRR